MSRNRGQILVVVIILMMVLAIIVPAMVLYIQNEAKWSVKQGQNSNAFQLAEAAIDRGYQKITESTGVWKSLQNGSPIQDFHFDRAYSELPGGSYTVAVTSGPGTQSATVIGIGRDKKQKEVRALKVVFSASATGNSAIEAANGVTMSGSNVDVEWGAIMSPKTINVGTKDHPSYYSASSIIINGTTYGPTDQHCDNPNCWWWKSYYSGVPPMPPIDFGFYQSSAAASGNTACTMGSGKSAFTLPYYYTGPADLDGSCTDLTGKTFYVTTNWNNFDGAVIGNVIVLGSLSFQNGKLNTLAAYDAAVPATAWKNYCSDLNSSAAWTVYQTYDANASGKSACFGSLNNTYQAANVKYNISPCVHGFMYVGGNLSLPTGGGNSGVLHGVIVVNGSADINANSHGRIYYDDSVASNIVMTKLVLARQSWQDVVVPWPAGL
jgi:type II secretory pathway pseudopilin PulG